MSSRFQINGTVVSVDDTTTRNLQVVMLVVANCAHEIESKYLAHIITRTVNFELTQQTTIQHSKHNAAEEGGGWG